MRLNLFWIIIAVLVLIAGAVGVASLKPEWIPFNPLKVSSTTSNTGSKGSGYVAVFLTNNQVYFGKLTGLANPYPSLTDVYYLRIQRSLQPEEGQTDVRVEDKDKTPPPEPKNEMTLIKLGNELHGPTDEIKLNRDQILFIEELKEDSKVVQAIKQHKNKK